MSTWNRQRDTDVQDWHINRIVSSRNKDNIYVLRLKNGTQKHHYPCYAIFVSIIRSFSYSFCGLYWMHMPAFQVSQELMANVLLCLLVRTGSFRFSCKSPIWWYFSYWCSYRATCFFFEGIRILLIEATEWHFYF